MIKTVFVLCDLDFIKLPSNTKWSYYKNGRKAELHQKMYCILPPSISCKNNVFYLQEYVVSRNARYIGGSINTYTCKGVFTYAYIFENMHIYLFKIYIYTVQDEQ